MEKKTHIGPFIILGEQLNEQLRNGKLDPVIETASQENPWFTPEYIRFAVQALREDMLQEEILSKWLSPYKTFSQSAAKRVGIIMAGNIPLVGFFDLMCVLICGHKARVKTSSKDRILIDHMATLLRKIEPQYDISDLGNEIPDAMIATGSDDTVRILKSKYADVPGVYRGSRSSYAVLTGNETSVELQALTEDVFTYFGLGCRNVSHLFVPPNYAFDRLIDAWNKKPIRHTGYHNNYRQTKALLELNGTAFLDGGYFVLTEQPPGIQALSRITYLHYDDLSEVEHRLRDDHDKIQCIVGGKDFEPGKDDSGDSPIRQNNVSFGQAQHPRPWNYPDGIDLIRFLLTL